jgi:Tfp pilus assembly protein PilF
VTLRPALVVAVLTALVLAVFVQSFGFAFINFDDDRYVSNNPVVQRGLTGEGIAFAFSVKNGFYWHPLTWLSLMAECSLAGVNPAVHHSVNVALHAAAVALVFVFFRRATGDTGRAAVTAAIFGLHPLRAESVAWIAERKDVLFGCTAALSLVLYARYAEQPSRARYAAVCAAVILSLFSKPAAVTLPLLLLVADYWPLRRGEPWAQLVREKVPLLAVSGVVAILTWVGQEAAGALSLMDQVPLHVRAVKSAEWLWRYLAHTFWPSGLVVPYHYDPSLTDAVFFWIAAIAITAGVVKVRHLRPYILAGWLWFVIGLLPSLGFVQAGGQSMADRFTYLPHVGLLAAIVWLAAETLPRRVAYVSAVVTICAVSIVCARQVSLWRDSVTLFSHAVEHEPHNWVARVKVGQGLIEKRAYADALSHLHEAVRLQPASFHTHYNLGLALAATGQHVNAASAFERAIALKPGYADAHYSLGAMLIQAARPADAERSLREAVRLGVDPRYASEAHNLLGASLAQRGRIAEALPEFENAVRMDARNHNARRNAATARQALAIQSGPGTPAR